MANLPCIKTGVSLYVESEHLLLHGDAFVVPAGRTIAQHYLAANSYDLAPMAAGIIPDTLLIRVAACWSADFPLHSRVHIAASAPLHWFDQRLYATRTDEDGNGTTYELHDYSPNSTLLVSPGEWAWLGYNGQLVEEALAHISA